MAEIGNTSVFSQTDGSNNSGTVPTWAEGQAPSQVNDSARALQGAVTREWNWRNPTLTSGGAADVQTLTYAVAPAAYYNGQSFAFIAGFTNTGACTLNVNTLGAIAVKKVVAGVQTALSAGDITAGHVYKVAYNTSGTAFLILSSGLATSAAASTTVSGIVELATDAETITGTDTVRAVTPSNLTAKFIGKQKIWVPASAMISRTTNGAAVGGVEMTTNKQMVRTLDFDTTTQEFAQFSIAMPKAWNEGTVTFAPVWSHAATVTNFGVVFGLEAVAISNDDTLDVAWGTVQTSTDTGGTTNDLYRGPESSAITIAGTPAADDTVYFQVKRVPADGSDTLAVDARLHGIELYFTTDAGTEA